MAIRFYGVRDAHGYLSNFAPYPIEVDGKVWPTSEHYFQAQKYRGTPREEVIRLARSPMIAARLGRSRAQPLRNDWERIKDDAMRKAVLAKFAQHADLRSQLLATGDEELVESTTRDVYWGCGTSGTGKNMLGRILMEVRAALRARS